MYNIHYMCCLTINIGKYFLLFSCGARSKRPLFLMNTHCNKLSHTYNNQLLITKQFLSCTYLYPHIHQAISHYLQFSILRETNLHPSSRLFLRMGSVCNIGKYFCTRLTIALNCLLYCALLCDPEGDFVVQIHVRVVFQCISPPGILPFVCSTDGILYSLIYVKPTPFPPHRTPHKYNTPCGKFSMTCLG